MRHIKSGEINFSSLSFYVFWWCTSLFVNIVILH
nr:MAG TPA: hypothetical protein [Caudoviricetes sp.]